MLAYIPPSLACMLKQPYLSLSSPSPSLFSDRSARANVLNRPVSQLLLIMYSVRLEPGTRHIRPEAAESRNRRRKYFRNEIKWRPKGAAERKRATADGAVCRNSNLITWSLAASDTCSPPRAVSAAIARVVISK